jgi:hypothetical protein
MDAGLGGSVEDGSMNAPGASWGGGTAWVAIALAALVGCPASGGEEGGGSSGGTCDPGEMQSCPCNDGTIASQTCRSDGLGFGACQCPITGGMADAPMLWAKPPAAAGTPATGAAGAPMTTAGAGGVAGAMIGSGGSGGVAGMMLPAGTGGAGGATTGGSGGSGGSGPVTPDDRDALRQQCVDYINMYRATLGKAPLARATPAQEACSDMGAKKDADSGQAHSSAGDCDGLGGQNTCPGWGVGGFSGNATLADAMTGCLDSMWDEGPPPKPDNECIADYQGCFLLHGHWMNMSNDMYSVVSCGFYEMPDGKWWMNQDFGF